MSLRVLFVDDEVKVLEAIQRNLRGKVRDWDLVFVTEGVDALDCLASRPFDVIVSDMMMPRMSGEVLLEQVQACFPAVARIVLSGECDQQTAFRLVGSDHLYLSKPCPTDLLIETIKNAHYVAKDFSEDHVEAADVRDALCHIVKVMLMRGNIHFGDLPEQVLKWLPPSTVNAFAPYQGTLDDFLVKHQQGVENAAKEKPYSWADLFESSRR